MKHSLYNFLAAATMLFTACESNSVTTEDSVAVITDADTTTSAAKITDAKGTSIDRIDASLDRLIAPDAKLQQIAAGYEWAEGLEWTGPTEGGMLIWSDVRTNTAYRWTEAAGASVLLKPSGYTGAYFAGKEPGSNRLFLDADGNLLLCQHGDRRIARMTAPLEKPKAKFADVVAFYEGKRLNSPNDVVWHENGDLYFTDPAYGLPGGQHESSVKELDFQGVYRFSFKDSTLTLLTMEISRPNGILFTPDYRHLIVANSEEANPVWTKFAVKADGTLGESSLFFDATPLTPGPQGGVPDGMAMHSSGTVFATGPGGILVISSSGQHIGTIKTGQTTANCTFTPDESMLYITADSLIMRLPMVTE